MSFLPPVPAWDAWHPGIVHFPIALAVVAPLFVVLALLWKPQARVLLFSAAVLMALAAVGAQMAVLSGEAAEAVAEQIPGKGTLLDAHEALALDARNFIVALAVVLALGTVCHWRWAARVPRGVFAAAGLAYLIASGACIARVLNAAHSGGRVVREVDAQTGASPAVPEPPPVSAPAILPPKGLEKTMEAIDDAFELLQDVQQAGWRTGAGEGSPEPAPAAIAGEIVTLLRSLQGDERVQAKPDDFLQRLEEARAQAESLEAGLLAVETTPTVLDQRFGALEASCDGCHDAHRD